MLSDVRVVGLLAFFCVVLLVAFSSIRVLQTNFELQKKENELTQLNKIKKLENENLRLKNIYLESNEYLELTARRQFNKALPGEKLYLIPKSVALARTKNVVKPKSANGREGESAGNKPGHQQNLEAWRNFFLHKSSENL